VRAPAEPVPFLLHPYSPAAGAGRVRRGYRDGDFGGVSGGRGL